MKTYIYLALLQRLHYTASSLVCPSPQSELKVARKGVFCSASSSFENMPCQFAWDGDPNTVWHPSGSGQGAYTTLHLDQGAVLHGLSIEQYNWPSGFASNISIMLHSSHWIDLQVKDGGSVAVWEAELKPVHTGNITLFIKKVGPYPGSAFGGMKDIKLRGCLASQAIDSWDRGPDRTSNLQEPTRTKDTEPEAIDSWDRGTDRIYNLQEPPRTKDTEPECEDIFNFGCVEPEAAGQRGATTSSSSSSSSSSSARLSILSLPVLGSGLAIITGFFLIASLVYGLQAKRRHQWRISEESRVSFSPSRQEGSSEEIYDLVPREEHH